MKKHSYITLFFSALVLLGCTPEDTEPLEVERYNADWALQVINSEFSLSDLLTEVDDNAYLDISNDTIRLVYTDSIEQDLEGDYYKVQDQSESINYTASDFQLGNIPAGVEFPLPRTEKIFPLDSPLDFNDVDIPNTRIRNIYVDGGTLEISVNYPSNYTDLDLTLTIPSLVNANGQIFSKTTTQNFSENINLDGYTINLEHNGNFNTFVATLEGRGTAPIGGIQSSDEFIFNFAMRDLTYSAIEGGLGNFTIPLIKGDGAMGFFEEFEPNTQFNLETFGIKTTTQGNWGIPLQLNIDTLLFENNTDNEVLVDLSGDIFIDRLPSLSEVDLNQFVTVKKGYNSTENPSLKNALKILPNKFSYALSVTGNPNNDQDLNMFISKKSKIKSKIEASIQLHGWLRRYTRRDTLEFDPIDLDDGEAVEKGSIRFILDNRIPIGLGVDLKFLDNNNGLLESFNNKVKIAAPSVNNEGYATGENSVQTDLELTQEQLKNITDNARKVILEYHIETSGGDTANPPNVHIRPSDKMKAIIGIRAKVSIDPNDQ